MCLLTQPKEGQQQFKNKNRPELTENRTVWKSDNQGDKDETFIQTIGGVEMGSWVERTHSKSAAGGPSEVADCGMGWAKLQLEDPTRSWLADPVAHICAQINREERRGSEADRTTQSCRAGELKPQTSD